jgi:hypothetical protein
MDTNGGPAFPLEHHATCKSCNVGMSLRDYFACHVFEGMLNPGGIFTQEMADKAYQAADLLLTSRVKE